MTANKKRWKSGSRDFSSEWKHIQFPLLPPPWIIHTRQPCPDMIGGLFWDFTCFQTHSAAAASIEKENSAVCACASVRDSTLWFEKSHDSSSRWLHAWLFKKMFTKVESRRVFWSLCHPRPDTTARTSVTNDRGYSGSWTGFTFKIKLSVRLCCENHGENNVLLLFWG